MREEVIKSEQNNLIKLQKELQDSRRTLDILISNLPGMVYRCKNDNEWTMVFVSDGSLKLTGYPSSYLEQNKKLSYFEIIHPEDREKVWDEVHEKISGSLPFTVEYRIVTASGEEKWVWEQGRAVDGEKQEEQLLEGFITDITSRKLAEKGLKASEERYQEILSSIEEGYLEADLEGKITFCNEAAYKAVGYSKEEIIGMNYRKLFVDPDKILAKFSKVFKSGESDKGYTMEVIKKDGVKVFVEFSISLIKDHQGIVKGFRGIGRDVTDRKHFEDKLKYISYHDQLTGLYNRAFMEQRLKFFEQNRSGAVSIILVDIDGLKLINDTMGHKQGDEVLKMCAGVLRNSLRNSDILSRFGGDEFAIILPDTGEEAANNICNRIRNLIEEYNKKFTEVYLGVSMGVATSPDEKVSLEDIFNEADDYMYQEKMYRNNDVHDKIAHTLLLKLNKLDYIHQGHSEKLKEFSLQLGKLRGLPEKNLRDLSLLAEVHDIGKVTVPEKVLNKKDPLSDDEWKLIKEHSEKGFRFARSIKSMASIADLILRHHEHWNGDGYPIGLKHEAIPLECRILAVAEAYEVMINERPYRNIKTPDEAREELIRCAGTQFDPEIVTDFLKILK